MNAWENAPRIWRAPDRVLVIIVTRIGDTLLATPAIRAIAETYPDAQITVLAHPKRAVLLENLPFIHRVGTITKYQALFCGWTSFWKKKRSFDAALVFGHDDALQAYALRISDLVVGQRREESSISFYSNRRLIQVAAPMTQEHAVDAGLRLASALGATPTGKQLSYVVTPTEREDAKRLLEQVAASSGGPGITAATPLIGLQLRSFPTKAYRDWPVSSFAALLQRLFDAFPQSGVVVLGDAASAEAANDLMQQFSGRICSLAGRMSLRQMAGVMSQLDLYIGVDTGPTHLAGALGLPMVALYHCRHRGIRLAPLGHPALSVIEHPATDEECGRDSCMAAISVDTVWHAVQQQLHLHLKGVAK